MNEKIIGAPKPGPVPWKYPMVWYNTDKKVVLIEECITDLNAPKEIQVKHPQKSRSPIKMLTQKIMTLVKEEIIWDMPVPDCRQAVLKFYIEKGIEKHVPCLETFVITNAPWFFTYAIRKVPVKSTYFKGH